MYTCVSVPIPSVVLCCANSKCSVVLTEGDTAKCRVEAQRFQHGDYTLLHDTDSHAGEMALDVVLFILGSGSTLISFSFSFITVPWLECMYRLFTCKPGKGCLFLRSHDFHRSCQSAVGVGPASGEATTVKRIVSQVIITCKWSIIQTTATTVIIMQVHMFALQWKATRDRCSFKTTVFWNRFYFRWNVSHAEDHHSHDYRPAKMVFVGNSLVPHPISTSLEICVFQSGPWTVVDTSRMWRKERKRR